jgi:hypothetical protein
MARIELARYPVPETGGSPFAHIPEIGGKLRSRTPGLNATLVFKTSCQLPGGTFQIGILRIELRSHRPKRCTLPLRHIPVFLTAIKAVNRS